MQNLDLNLLRLFDEVYRAGNVSRAAERLGLTQPAASQGLTRLRLRLKDPLFVRAPGGVQPTLRAVALAEQVQGALAALTQAPTHPERPLDGVNLMPYLTGQKAGVPHETIYLRMYDRGAFAVRSGDFKLVIPQAGGAAQLYQISADVAEANNVAGRFPAQLEQLEQRRGAWNAQLIPPVFEGLMTPRKPNATNPPPEVVP